MVGFLLLGWLLSNCFSILLISCSSSSGREDVHLGFTGKKKKGGEKLKDTERVWIDDPQALSKLEKKQKQKVIDRLEAQEGHCTRDSEVEELVKEWMSWSGEELNEVLSFHFLDRLNSYFH